MSSLDYTYENLDKLVPRSNFLAPTIDPKKTMLLVLDMQKACAEVGGAMYIESVGGAPEGKDVVEPVKNVLAACRAKGIPVVWSLWGLRPDGADAGFADVKWGLTGQLKEWPGSWGNGGDELVDGLEPAEGEPVIRKHRFSSFYHTALNEYMRRAGADTLIVAGLSTGNCQLATAATAWWSSMSSWTNSASVRSASTHARSRRSISSVSAGARRPAASAAASPSRVRRTSNSSGTVKSSKIRISGVSGVSRVFFTTKTPTP